MLLVHGWMFPSDLNWLHTYRPLCEAGYRVLAMDLRGHGRGLRSGAHFRLADCADDAAGVLTALGLPPALVVGYSMGGTVAQLLARRHPDRVAGLVLCATALDWSDPRMKVFWRMMGGLRRHANVRCALPGLMTALGTVSLAGRLTAADRPA